jgi:hypothetical protein
LHGLKALAREVRTLFDTREFALFYLPLSTGEAQLGALRKGDLPTAIVPCELCLLRSKFVALRKGNLPTATDPSGLCLLPNRLLRTS